MSDESKPILGWDFARGADGGEELVGQRPPARAVLFTPATPGQVHQAGPYATMVDVWGFDPKLTVTPQFFHQLAASIVRGPTNNPKTNLAVTIEAWAITKGDNASEGVIELYRLDGTKLFAQGGTLPDGCELSTAITGIRFKLAATVGGDGRVDHEIALTLVVLTNAALHCRALALEAASRFHVTIPPPVTLVQDEG